MLHNIRGCFPPVLLGVLLLCVAAPSPRADSKQSIDKSAREALIRLRAHSNQAGKLLDRAAGVLVCPDVVKMGFGVGGEYGEGSLLIGGEPAAYYVTAGASFGLQVGARIKSEVILFMTDKALQKFRGSRGWKVGVDGSVALVKLGGGAGIDTATIEEPVVGFIFSNRGLMYNLTMEGSKITRIAR